MHFIAGGIMMNNKICENYFTELVNYVQRNRFRRCLTLKAINQDNFPIFDSIYSLYIDKTCLPLPECGRDIRIILPTGELVSIRNKQQDLLELANEVIERNDNWSSLARFLAIRYEEAPAFLVANCSCLVINSNQHTVYKSLFSTAYTDYRSQIWLHTILFSKDYFPKVERVQWFTDPKYLPEAHGVLTEFSKKMMAK